MSLMNDVLKNLERRRATHSTKEQVQPLFGHSIDDEPAAKPSHWRRRMWTLILLLTGVGLGCGGYYAYQYLKQGITNSSPRKALLQQKHSQATTATASHTPMVELANPPIKPSTNAPLPPPSDLPNVAGNTGMPTASASGSDLATDHSDKPNELRRQADKKPQPTPASTDSTNTISVPLSTLQTAAGATPDNGDGPGDFSLVAIQDNSQRIRQQLQQIDHLIQAQQLQRAEDLIHQLPSDTSEQEKTLLQAKLLIARNQNSQAIQLLEHYDRTHRPYADCLGMLAMLYDITGRYGEAQDIYQKLTNYWPTESKWWLGLAIASMHNGQYSLAIRSFEQVQNMQSQLSPEVNSYVHTQLLALTTDHPTFY